jgi:N-acetylglucosaminyldiphosphoundecaprenol N-acetyl-beta-D-mannosaminyltransferase
LDADTFRHHTIHCHNILGYSVAACNLDQACQWCIHHAEQAKKPQLVVTLNPEIVVQAREVAVLERAIQAASLVVADGVGMLWAARQLASPLPERVTGVDLMFQLLERAPHLRVFLLGGKPGVAERAAKIAQTRYGSTIVGCHHGYFDKQHPDEVISQIVDSHAQLLFAGLGEGQEIFLNTHKDSLGVPVMMGVGGSLDVLSGEVYRAPTWTRQLGIEWAWRVGLDPSRWHRIPRLLTFMRLVQQAKSAS